MNKLLYSSISKKFVMALAGLFLLLFLPASGNKPDAS